MSSSFKKCCVTSVDSHEVDECKCVEKKLVKQCQNRPSFIPRELGVSSAIHVPAV